MMCTLPEEMTAEIAAGDVDVFEGEAVWVVLGRVECGRVALESTARVLRKGAQNNLTAGAPMNVTKGRIARVAVELGATVGLGQQVLGGEGLRATAGHDDGRVGIVGRVGGTRTG